MKTSSSDYFGVPKDSDLEPDYVLAQGSGTSTAKCGAWLPEHVEIRIYSRFISPAVDWNSQQYQGGINRSALKIHWIYFSISEMGQPWSDWRTHHGRTRRH